MHASAHEFEMSESIKSRSEDNLLDGRARARLQSNMSRAMLASAHSAIDASLGLGTLQSDKHNTTVCASCSLFNFSEKNKVSQRTWQATRALRLHELADDDSLWAQLTSLYFDSADKTKIDLEKVKYLVRRAACLFAIPSNGRRPLARDRFDAAAGE